MCAPSRVSSSLVVFFSVTLSPSPLFTVVCLLPIHCLSTSHFLHHGPSPQNTHRRAGTRDNRSCFHSNTHTHSHKRGYKHIHKHTHRTHAHARTHQRMAARAAISIWGLSCQTWPMSLSSVIMAVFIFSDRPAGLGASRGVVWMWKHTLLKTSSLAEKRAHSTLTRNW